jgi:D-alanyl-D-alanine carboxypeptidase
LGKWLNSALDYIPQWIGYQMRQSGQPGCVVAIAEKGKLVLEIGHADLGSGATLTPRHRFRVASHSKSFTAAGILKLREQGKVTLDDRIGRYVEGLHAGVARATIAELLSHSAGITRDGVDSGQWQDRRFFPNATELRAALAEAPVIARNSRFKYSNHGFGLLGLVIEAIAREPYCTWIKREIIEAAGLGETAPDMWVGESVPMARGHSGKLPLGRRLVIPGDNQPTPLLRRLGLSVPLATLLASSLNSIRPRATACCRWTAGAR